MKQISIQSVGRSIPINFYEPKIPEEVLRLAQEWSKKRENYKNPSFIENKLKVLLLYKRRIFNNLYVYEKNNFNCASPS